MTYYKAEGILLFHVSQQCSFLSEVRGSARVAESEEMYNPLLLYFITAQVLINKHLLWHMLVYIQDTGSLLPLLELCSKLWGIWHILMNKDRVWESFPATEIAHLIRTLIKNKYSSSTKVCNSSLVCLSLKLETVNINSHFLKNNKLFWVAQGQTVLVNQQQNLVHKPNLQRPMCSFHYKTLQLPSFARSQCCSEIAISHSYSMRIIQWKLNKPTCKDKG